jgi:hypothetical protein
MTTTRRSSLMGYPQNFSVSGCLASFGRGRHGAACLGLRYRSRNASMGNTRGLDPLRIVTRPREIPHLMSGSSLQRAFRCHAYAVEMISSRLVNCGFQCSSSAAHVQLLNCSSVVPGRQGAFPEFHRYAMPCP